MNIVMYDPNVEDIRNITDGNMVSKFESEQAEHNFVKNICLKENYE